VTLHGLERLVRGARLVIIWAYVGIAMNQRPRTNIVRIAEINAILVAIALVASMLVIRLKR